MVYRSRLSLRGLECIESKGGLASTLCLDRFEVRVPPDWCGPNTWGTLVLSNLRSYRPPRPLDGFILMRGTWWYDSMMAGTHTATSRGPGVISPKTASKWTQFGLILLEISANFTVNLVEFLIFLHRFYLVLINWTLFGTFYCRIAPFRVAWGLATGKIYAPGIPVVYRKDPRVVRSSLSVRFLSSKS